MHMRLIHGYSKCLVIHLAKNTLKPSELSSEGLLKLQKFLREHTPRPPLAACIVIVDLLWRWKTPKNVLATRLRMGDKARDNRASALYPYLCMVYVICVTAESNYFCRCYNNGDITNLYSNLLWQPRQNLHSSAHSNVYDRGKIIFSSRDLYNIKP